MKDLNVKILIYSFLIILIFGISSIRFQVIIGLLSILYIPTIFFLNHRNFKINYWKTLTILCGLILLNELIIRILGNIKINSSGNPYAVLFFILTLIFTFFTLYIENARIDSEKTSKRILFSFLIFILIALFYCVITKPL